MERGKRLLSWEMMGMSVIFMNWRWFRWSIGLLEVSVLNDGDRYRGVNGTYVISKLADEVEKVDPE